MPLTKEWSSSVREGCPIPWSTQPWDRCTWSGGGGWEHCLDSQISQNNPEVCGLLGITARLPSQPVRSLSLNSWIQVAYWSDMFQSLEPVRLLPFADGSLWCGKSSQLCSPSCSDCSGRGTHDFWTPRNEWDPVRTLLGCLFPWFSVKLLAGLLLCLSLLGSWSSHPF